MKSPNPQKKKPSKKTGEQGEGVKALLDAELKRINQNYSVLQRGNNVHIMYEGYDSKGKREISYLSPKDFLVRMANVKIYDDENEKFVAVGPLWISWEGRRDYDGIYFYPGDEDRPRYYNLWKGFTHTPSTNGSCDKFIAHIKNNICNKNDDAFKWVMGWLADIFQRPAHKPGTALVLRGEMGIGKGVFANHIGHLLGQHYLTVSNASQVTGRFNSHMAEKVMMFVDESFWSGEKVGAGVLRALITEPQQSSEMKGRDIVMIDSFLRLIIAANDDWVVPVGMADERRFTVLDVGKGSQRDFKYFKEIKTELENGGYGALLHTLLAYKYEENAPRTIISTNALLDQKLHSMKDELKWWYDCLAEETIDACGDWPNGENGIRTKDFYDAYSLWFDRMKGKNKLSANSLPRALSKYVPLVNKKSAYGRCYYLGELSKCRADFERALGHSIKWGDE